MNIYNKKDIIQLVDMIDANNHIVVTETSSGIYKNEAFGKIRNPGVSNEQALEIFQRILRLLAPKVCIEDFFEFTIDKPLSTMPLHINDKDDYGLIAKWRLKIGK